MSDLFMPLLLFAAIALIAMIGVGEVAARLGFPMPAGGERTGALDGLRGFLAPLVMVHHFAIWTALTRFGVPWGPPSQNLLNSFGPGAVALFFMTTGFLFYPRILKGIDKVDWRATYISRVFRILPLQAVVLVAIIAIALAWRAPLAGARPVEVAKAVLSYLGSWGESPLFSPGPGKVNASVIWSLWYEWMFYLFALPLLSLVRKLSAGMFPSWVIPAALFLIGLTLGPRLSHPMIVFYLPLFACGMAAYELGKHGSIVAFLRGPIATIASVASLAAAMTLAHEPYGFPQILGYAFFFACVANGNTMGGVLASKGARVLGEVSFGIYLTHALTLFIAFTAIIPRSVSAGTLPYFLPLVGVVVALQSILAHLAIERPGIALGRRIAGKRPPRNSIEAAAVEIAP